MEEPHAPKYKTRERRASQERGVVAYILIAARLTALGHFQTAASMVERADWSLQLLKDPEKEKQ